MVHSGRLSEIRQIVIVRSLLLLMSLLRSVEGEFKNAIVVDG